MGLVAGSREALERGVRAVNHARPWRREIAVWGKRVRVSSLDRCIYAYLHRWGIMGAPERRALRSVITPGMRTVDVGANIGLYTLYLAELVRSTGRVFAFEPEPDLYARLQENCALNGAHHVRTFNFALGRQAGRSMLHRSSLNSGDNRLGPRTDASSLVEVPVVSLDEVLANEHVDFIKIDVQGHELAVLQGMAHVCRSNPALRIYFEFSPPRPGVEGDRAVVEYLWQEQFRIFHFQGDRWAPLRAWDEVLVAVRPKSFANLLAVRGELSTTTGDWA